MAEVLACQVVILDGTTISQDVNVSNTSCTLQGYKIALFSAADRGTYEFVFAEESRGPSATKPRV